MRTRTTFYLLLLLFIICKLNAQEVHIKKAEKDSIVQVMEQGVDSLHLPIDPKLEMKHFKPDSHKSVLYALVPGLGQIYNRKYWKLPLVYGGFMACFYAITWNNTNYQDYHTAYLDRYDDVTNYPNEPSKWHQSWQNFLPASVSSADYIDDSNFAKTLERGKDYYRRYRDLSVLITVGIYAITIIDAYVDAELYDFDITQELSMRIAPVVSPKTSVSNASYGLNCRFTF